MILISLPDALEAALTAHPDLRAAEVSVDAADAATRLARAGFDPTLTAGTDISASESQSYVAGYPTASTTTAWSGDVGVNGELATGTSWSVDGEIARQIAATSSSLGGVPSEQETDTWATSFGVTVRQDLLVLLRPTSARIALRQAEERADEATLTLLQARQAALAEVADLWWTWKTTVAREDVARRAVEQAQALEAVTAAWVAEGQAERLELSRVTTDRLAADQTLADAEAAVDAAADAVLVRIGGQPGADVAPDGEGSLAPLASTDPADHLRAAEASSPTLALVRLQLESAEAGARDVRWDGLPSLALTGSFGVGTLDTSAGAALTALGTDDAFPAYAAGVELSLPLGGRAAAARQDGARAEVRLQEYAYDDARVRLDADLRAALRSVETARRGVDLSTARLEVARATEDGERARTEAGLRRLDQLLDATGDRLDAEVDLLSARLDLGRATLNVARLEGGVDTLLVR
jgi:outer membrane protein TolC